MIYEKSDYRPVVNNFSLDVFCPASSHCYTKLKSQSRLISNDFIMNSLLIVIRIIMNELFAVQFLTMFLHNILKFSLIVTSKEYQ